MKHPFGLFIIGLALILNARAGVAARDDLEQLGMKVSVTIIFDTSGSMNENNKLAMAKQAFNWWLEKAPVTRIAQWTLWNFNARSDQGNLLVDRKPDASERIKSLIAGFVAAGSTPLVRTVTKVTQAIDAENTRAEQGKADILRQVVLIFTDGKDSNVPEAAAQQAILKLRKVGAEVFSIGYQGEGQYLARVSDKFYMVSDEVQLKAGLEEFSYFIEKTNK